MLSMGHSVLVEQSSKRSFHWGWLFLGSCLFGVLATSAIFTSEHVAMVGLLVLAAPILLLALPVAICQGVGHATKLMKSLHWWHGAWGIAYASSLVWEVRTLRAVSEAPLDAASGARMALDSILFLILMSRFARRRDAWVGSTFKGLVGCMAIFSLVCLASSAWSVSPIWTLIHSGEFLQPIALLGAALLAIRTPEEYKSFLDWTWTIYGLHCAAIWCELLVAPRLVLQPDVGLFGIRLDGGIPLMGANINGEFAAILGVIALSRLILSNGKKATRMWYTILLLWSAGTMILSQTRTAIVGFALGTFLLLFLLGKKLLNVFLIVCGTTVLSIGSVAAIMIEYVERGQSGYLQKLTGRLEMWEYTWHMFIQRPWTGYGAYAGSKFVVFGGLHYDLSTLHSDWLEILIGTSVWGLLPIVAALAGTWFVLYKAIRDWDLSPLGRQLAIETVGILAILTVRSFLNVTLIWHPALPFLAVLGYAEFLRRQRTMMLGNEKTVESP